MDRVCAEIGDQTDGFTIAATVAGWRKVTGDARAHDAVFRHSRLRFGLSQGNALTARPCAPSHDVAPIVVRFKPIGVYSRYGCWLR
jgi:hypothetical protein